MAIDSTRLRLTLCLIRVLFDTPIHSTWDDAEKLSRPVVWTTLRLPIVGAARVVHLNPASIRIYLATKISVIAQNGWLDLALGIPRFKVIPMANNTTQLTRRSFSTWLATSGFVLTTSRRASAENSIESEQVHRVTGNGFEVPAYLNDSPVPIERRLADHGRQVGHTAVVRSDPSLRLEAYGQVSLERRAQDGRPPSEWLRSMDSEELREWLAKVEVSEAGVHGMTFWTHLTRDHLFRPLLIKGLTEVEQAKLHAAAHFGY
jgi:hypothetical protein